MTLLFLQLEIQYQCLVFKMFRVVNYSNLSSCLLTKLLSQSCSGNCSSIQCFQIADTKTSDNTHSLMDYLYDIIAESYPHLKNFQDELGYIAVGEKTWLSTKLCHLGNHMGNHLGNHLGNNLGNDLGNHLGLWILQNCGCLHFAFYLVILI